MRNIILALTFASMPFFAQATPQLVRVSSYIFNSDGSPSNVDRDIQVNVYSQSTGGSTLWTSNVFTVSPASGGRVELALDASLGSPSLAQVIDEATSELWAEMTIDLDAANGSITSPKTIQPRFIIRGSLLAASALSTSGLSGLAVSTAVPSDQQILKWSGTEWLPAPIQGTSGLGNMNGPASSTNNAAMKFSGITTVVNSNMIVDDSGNTSGPAGITANAIHSSTLTPNRLVRWNASKILVSVTANVTPTEFATLEGVTGTIQTQIATKKPALAKGSLVSASSAVIISGGVNSVIGSDTTINVNLAASTMSGMLSASDWVTFDEKLEPVTGASNLAIRTSSDGASWGLGAVDVSALNAVTGSLATSHGGTGVTVAASVFDAISPTSTAGDLLTHDGTNPYVLPAGLEEDYLLLANPAATGGMSWNSLSMVPVGGIVAWTSATPPSGFLLCNGSSYARTAYPGLFAVIGTAYGAANGSSFNVPDYRGYFERGRDGGAGRDPNAGSRTAAATGGATGDNVGSVQSDTYKSHTHSYTQSFSHGWGSSAVSGSTWQASLVSASDAAGGNETRPVNAYVNFIIRY